MRKNARFWIFQTLLPDDTQWSADGEDVSLVGGRTVAIILRDALQGKGATLSHVELYDEVGWEFSGEVGPRQIRCILQRFDPEYCLLGVEVRFQISKWFRSAEHRKYVEEVVSIMSECLATDTNFYNVTSSEAMTWDEVGLEAYRRFKKEQ